VLGRHGFTAGLWIASAVIVGVVAVRGVPWLWPRIFPRPGEGLLSAPPAPEEIDVPTVQVVGEVVDRLVSSWGAELGAPEEALSLPRGRTPRNLQDALRSEPRLRGTTIYVTALDPVSHRLRVFDGPRLLLTRDLRRWMPERPAVRAADAPEIGLVFRFVPEEPATFGRILKWKSPMAVALPPFSPESMRAAAKAIKAGKDVIVELDPEVDVIEQLEALPGVTGVLLSRGFESASAEAALGRALVRRDLFLLDAREGALRRVEATGPPPAEAPALRIALAAHLDSEEAGVLGRNLAVRWGHGLVTADAAGDGPALAEAFLEIAKEDG
jgi:hypothetical protein